MKPDRAGIWLFTYDTKEIDPNVKTCEVCIVNDILGDSSGWWCFVCDMPDVASPAKTVTQYLWVQVSDNGSVTPVWLSNEQSADSDWQPTNITREVEEPQQ